MTANDIAHDDGIADDVDTDDGVDGAGDPWLDGCADPLVDGLLHITKGWKGLPCVDAPLQAALQRQIHLWLVDHHARISPAASWIVLTNVFGVDGLAQALDNAPGCPMAALFRQASAHFADPPSQWKLCETLLGLTAPQRAALVAQGFPLRALCTEKRATKDILEVALTIDDPWLLDLWKASHRKHPVFAYWAAKKGLALPRATLSPEGAAAVLEALDLWCKNKITKEIRSLSFESNFDPRVWAAGVVLSTAQGVPHIFPLRRSKALMGIDVDGMGWLLDPAPTAHQQMERAHRMANARPVLDVLRMDNGLTGPGPDGYYSRAFRLENVFPAT
jgi:hypothetical protein